MERHAFAMKVKDGQMNTYRRRRCCAQCRREVSKGQTDRGNPGYFSVDFYSGRGYASDVS